MWVYVENWLVQDGEIPELRVGDTLRDAALRAACLSLREAGEGVREGVVERPQTNTSSGRVSYQVTGTAEALPRPDQVVLRVGERRLLAEPGTVRRVPGASPSDWGLERYSPDFVVPPVGGRVTAVCTWEVLAAYEIGPWQLRADWRVRGLRIERRAKTPVELERAAIVRVDTVDRLSCWGDEHAEDRITYILDLDPVPSAE